MIARASRVPCVVIAVAVAAALAACGGGAGDDTGGDDGPIYSEDHPRIYLPRAKERLAARLAADGPEARRFKALVDRWVGGDEVYDFQAWYAALVGQLTGDPRYCTAAIAAVDAQVIAEGEAIGAGELPDVARDSYLEVGPRVGDVMLVYDWCFDAVTSDQRERWLAYANQAVWNVWHPEEARWASEPAPWSGWSIDNPSNNYYYSFLRATMFLGLAAHGELEGAIDLLDFVRDEKILGQLVPTFDRDLVGGGSREGTGYGVSMARLFELYDFWEGSTGENLAGRTVHTRASLLHFLHTAVPTRDRVAPTGDHSRDSTAALFDYHRNYVQVLATLYGDDPVSPRARWFLSHSSVPQMDNEFMYVYDFLYAGDGAEEPMDELGRAYYAPGIGELYNRSSWGVDATWVNLIAGPYTESHAHQDQGSLMIYKGEWLAYDPNVESGSGLHQEVDAHNLVRVVDSSGATVEQEEPTTSELVALHRGDGWLHAAADLTAAYGGSSRVSRVEREIVHLEPDVIVVFDRVDSASGTQQVWQLSSPRMPAVSGTRAVFQGASHALTVERVLPAGASVGVLDWTSAGDFGGGYRLDHAMLGGAVRYLHVLWLDGAVGTVAASDAGSQRGVTITFADGRSATVRFGADSVNGRLELRSAGGSVTESADLGPGVDTLPE